MSVGDIPNITSSAYGSNTQAFNLGQAVGGGFVAPTTSIMKTMIPVQQNPFVDALREQQHQRQQEKPMSERRLVQVFIADPDENLPLDKSLLYTGEQKFTDATDQELYFEIDIKSILDKHNEVRAQTVNKKVKERVEYLDPAKIRDLKMVVVTVAKF